MSAAEILRPNEALHRIHDQDFGLRPDNFSIKPVHIANGLARALTRRSYRSTALQQMLRRYVRNQRAGNVLEERHSTSSMLERYPVAFSTAEASDPERVNALRTLARGLLGADDAVFDNPDQSSYTLANERFITRDPSDYRAGPFLARLLTAGGDGEAATLLRTLLEDESDAYTTLAMPLLTLAEAREEGAGGDDNQLAALDRLFTVDDAGALVSPTLRTLRNSFDRLARFEQEQGSKLNSLRRMVLFGCFTIHVHLINRWSEVVDDAPRPPILIDMFDGARYPLRDASRATVVAAGQAVEGLILHRLQQQFADLEDDDATTLLSDERLAGKGHDDLVASFDALRQAEEQRPGQALAEAYLQVGYLLTGGHPLGYLTELGRRAGYLTPWASQGRGGKTLKRYGATTEFLETLVAASVDPDVPVTFEQFLDVLRNRFGIIAGRPRDDATIRHNNFGEARWGNSTSIAEEDLRLNVLRLRAAILESGYAKAYADGQTVITSNPDRPAGL